MQEEYKIQINQDRNKQIQTSQGKFFLLMISLSKKKKYFKMNFKVETVSQWLNKVKKKLLTSKKPFFFNFKFNDQLSPLFFL